MDFERVREEKANTGATPPKDVVGAPILDIQQLHNEAYADREYGKLTREEPRLKMIQEILKELVSGTKILDVGCADGEVLRPHVGRLQVFGVDFVQSFVQQANEVGVKAQQCDFSKQPLPFSKYEFDTVFTGETIEHLIDTDLFLSQINRVLKPGGQLLMTVPNVRTPISIAMMMFLGLPPQFSARYRSPHYRDFTLRTLRLALQNNGFEITQAEGASIFIPGLGEVSNALIRRLPSWASQMVIQARKVKDVDYDPSRSISVELYAD